MAVIEIFDNDDEQAQAEATKTPKPSKPRSRSRKSAANPDAASDTPSHVSGPSVADSEAARKASGTGRGRKPAEGKTSRASAENKTSRTSGEGKPSRKPAEGKTSRTAAEGKTSRKSAEDKAPRTPAESKRTPRKSSTKAADVDALTVTPVASPETPEAKPARKPRTRKTPVPAETVGDAAATMATEAPASSEAASPADVGDKPKRTRRGGKGRKRGETPAPDEQNAQSAAIEAPQPLEEPALLEQPVLQQPTPEQAAPAQAAPEESTPEQSPTDADEPAPLLEIAAAPEKVAIAAAPQRVALEATPPILPALTQFSPAPNAPPLVLPVSSQTQAIPQPASPAAAETGAEPTEGQPSKSRSRSARRRKAARKRAEAAAAAAAAGLPLTGSSQPGMPASSVTPPAQAAQGAPRMEIFDVEDEDDDFTPDGLTAGRMAPDAADSADDREYFSPSARSTDDDTETDEARSGDTEEAPRSRRSRSRRGRGKKAAPAPVVNEEADDASDIDADMDYDDEDEGPVTPPKTDRRMLVSVLPRELVEVVIMDDGKVQEYYVEMEHQAKIRGNIYKAVVSNIDVNLQAAFVNYGNVKNGFLQIDEVHPEYWLTHHEPTKGHKYPPIQKVMKPGQEVLVQVVKEPNGAKGAFLTTWVSLAGRFLVLTPGQEQIGISRKVEDGEERNRLRELIKGLNPGEGLGAIVRTVSAGTSKTTLQKDLSFLKRVWKDIRKRAGTEKAPCLIYKEPSLATRAVRDYLSDDVAEVWVDDAETAEAIRDMTSLLFPRKADLLHLHQNSSKTLWEQFKVRKYLDQIHAREVFLPSGGRLVFDQTEALMAIDINSGKSGGKTNFESMALRTNVEAAEMIAHQLRLRDIGGQVVIDFIEMRDQSHCREVEKTMRNAMKGDRARYDIGKMSSFGLMQIVRQRIGSSAISISQEPCPHCSGTGLRRNMEWQSLQILRDLKVQMRNAATTCQPELLLPLETELAVYILNHKRERLCALEKEFGVRLEIRIGVDKIPA